MRVKVVLIHGVILSLSWILAYVTRFLLNPLFPNPINPILPYLWFLPLLLMVSLSLYGFFNLFEIRKEREIEEMGDFLKANLLALLGVMSLAFLFKGLRIGRSVILIFALYNLILIPPLRIWWKRKFIAPLPVILLGEEGILPRVYERIKNSPYERYRVLGYLSSSPLPLEGINYLGKPEDLRKVLKDNSPKELFLAYPRLPRDELLALILEAEKYGVEVKVLTDMFGLLTQKTHLGDIDGIPICYLPLRKPAPFYEITKRFLDITLSLTGMIITLPLWIILPVAIKLSSPGPVFFLQERVGKDGKRFRMIKFRTMYEDTPAFDYAPTSPQDPRITPVGKIIRRMSLDELPQLINVIRGEMSLVGPRPEMPFIVEKYTEWQKKRLEVKPGITGLWQIMGRKDLPLHENLEYDFYYIRNRSLLLDLVIILKTIPQVLLRKGAY